MNEVKLCRLCEVNMAEKKNSHIVPKFMTRSLFLQEGHRITKSLHKDGREQNHQDTPKQDDILCECCEKRISVIETMFAPELDRIYKFESRPKGEFSLIAMPGFTLRCEITDPKLFKIFFYTILWRLSICDVPEFATFKLDQDNENYLRCYLNDVLRDTQKVLKESLKRNIRMPDLHMCVVKPIEKTYPPGGSLSAHSFSSTYHLVMLVDFCIFVATDDETLNGLQNSIAALSTARNERVLIGLGSNESWIELNRMLVDQMMNRDDTN